MLPKPIRLAVTDQGRKYIVKSIRIRENGNLVETKGEVLKVSGFSVVYGPDKKFFEHRAVIKPAEYTAELLEELLKQGTIK